MSSNVAHYYAWLTRFQDAVRRLGHDTGQHTLTVHRLLHDPATGRRSGDVLHEVLLRALDKAGALPRRRAGAREDSRWRVLDAGCGLGGTVLYLYERIPGDYIGVTLSADQCERARAEARARGSADRCRFAVRSYDADLDDILGGTVDLVLAVESLAHSASPTTTLGRLTSRLGPGGHIAIVDDMPAEHLASNDPDFEAFRRGWMCPAVASATELEAAAGGAGLRLAYAEDLTALVPRRSRFVLRTLSGATNTLRRAAGATRAGVLVESLDGGLALERLYQRELMSYRLLVFERSTRSFVVA